MSDRDTDQNDGALAIPAPFKALIAGWSLIVVVLSVAGYSFRWNYYYNFGLQGLVLVAPLESLPVYAIEIARNRAFLLDVLWQALILLLPFHLALLALRKAREAGNAKVRNATRAIMRIVALDNRLLTEAIAAGLVMLIAFRAGGDAGYRAYQANVLESTSNLPRVTAIVHSGDAPAPIVCDTRTFKDPQPPRRFVGDARVLDSLLAGAACSMEGRSWRLLLRDERFVYLFATVTDARLRPQTLVLPDGGDLTLVLQ